MTTPIDMSEITLRLLCAAGAGGLLGVERESHGRAAGLRTTMLVTLGSCLGMLISHAFYAASFTPNAGAHPDPMRLAAGILTGMGFIGAGTIMRQGNLIRGVTTAAVLWLSVVLGIAFGVGLYRAAMLGLALGLMAVHLLPYAEEFIQKDSFAELILRSEEQRVPLEAVESLLRRHGIAIEKIDLSAARGGAETITLHVRHRLGRNLAFPGQLRDELLAIDGVESLSWQ